MARSKIVVLGNRDWRRRCKLRPRMSMPPNTEVPTSKVELSPDLQAALARLATEMEGELEFGELVRSLYATDASVYQAMPLAVAFPKTEEDIVRLIRLAGAEGLSLIPRAAGTSLAGQCVGDGIVVDISRHFTEVLEINVEEGWTRVQPGVIRDELNRMLQPQGLFFSPVTSTSNRAMIGGMIGNNSCGTNSIVYGTTRDHVLELKGFLSDGSPVTFSALSPDELAEKQALKGLEGQLYRHLVDTLGKTEVQAHIREGFPKPTVTRRNTGYALDMMLEAEPFSNRGVQFNFSRLICGSEGTLAFITEAKLHLDALPPPRRVLLAAHFTSIQDCLKATQLAMKHRPFACEMMDKVILDCTKGNRKYRAYRGFIEGDPEGVLLVEFKAEQLEEADHLAAALEKELQANGLGYAYPRIREAEINNVWALRKAGLGLLANIPGDPKAVACIEDTAVAIEDLADYIADFTEMMDSFGQRCVYYAHAGAGELHLRPILNLKSPDDVVDFYRISEESAKLVKKYRGSLSGEHGDGRVRAAFIPLVMGEQNYALFKELKQVWDPRGIFNPGKIVDAKPMDESLRYEPGQATPELDTLMDFSEVGGMLRMAEKCNGSGDCRKLSGSGGTMCPSYQVTRQEKDTTRGRANTLRNFLSREAEPNAFDHEEIREVLKYCLSCKGCTSECPSNVDMSSMKAEFLHQYYQSHGVPFKAKAIARVNKLNKVGAIWPGMTNWMLNGPLSGPLVKGPLGIAREREMPRLAKTTLRKWFRRWKAGKGTPSYHDLRQKGKNSPAGIANRKVVLFVDEFTNFYDVGIGQKAIRLLTGLGYEVEIADHAESGRAAISKGLLPMAKKFANENVRTLSPLVSRETPLIGLEPSAILTFRDEYPRLVDRDLAEKSRSLATHTFLLEEFLDQEVQAGRINAGQFSDAERTLLVHGHCHQKALSGVFPLANALDIPRNYTVQMIPSGCCGMAGSFGYEKDNYELSMQIGELVLFPSVRNADAGTVIVAPGTSCRHQIHDGTQRQALHPVEVLWDAFLHP